MNTRAKPMKLIVGGMPRTGTCSIMAALQQLGFTAYAYCERLDNGDLSWWASQLQAKYDGLGGEDMLVEYRGKIDFMTSNYDCFLDTPCSLMTEELAKAYPEAKVLLNERDVDAWLSSMNKTIAAPSLWDQTWPTCAFLYLDPYYARPIILSDRTLAAVLCDSNYKDGDKLKQRFVEHYAGILLKVEPSRVLRYKVQDGWKSLCEFLELDCPPSDHPFPRVNDAEVLQATIGEAYQRALRNSIRNLAIGVAAIGGTAYMMIYY